MKVKTSELTGAALDWAVAKCEYQHVSYWPDGRVVFLHPNTEWMQFAPSTNWAQGGPIIDRHPRCAPQHDERFYSWFTYGQSPAMYGKQSFLEAAMRCYVTSKLGDFVEVPEELLNVN